MHNKAICNDTLHKVDEELSVFINSMFSHFIKEKGLKIKLQDIKITSLKSVTYSIIVKFNMVFSSCSKQMVAKISKNMANGKLNIPQVKREWEVLTALYSELGDRIKGALNPIFYFENERFQAMITEEIKGETLHSILVQELKNLFPSGNSYIIRHYLCSAGQWLKRFQEITQKPYDRQSVYSVYEDIPNRIYKQLDDSERMNALDKRLAKKIYTYVRMNENLWDELSSLGLVGTHSDFIPVNIMVKNDNQDIIVLDFTNFKYSLAYRDVVSFLCSLDFFVNKFVIKKRIIEKWKRYFLDGYGKLDKNYPVYRLCYIRENLGYLINLYRIPSGSRLKNIAVMWSVNRVKVNLQKTIEK